MNRLIEKLSAFHIGFGNVLKTRTEMINKPAVTGFRDSDADGLIRVLRREDGSYYPELTLYVDKADFGIRSSLVDSGFKEEERGKWVLGTNKMNVFVYVKQCTRDPSSTRLIEAKDRIGGWY
jgi:hypothetical protein